MIGRPQGRRQSFGAPAEHRLVKSRSCVSEKISDGTSDYRCLTARYRIISREAGLKDTDLAVHRRACNEGRIEHVDGIVGLTGL